MLKDAQFAEAIKHSSLIAGQNKGLSKDFEMTTLEMRIWKWPIQKWKLKNWRFGMALLGHRTIVLIITQKISRIKYYKGRNEKKVQLF